MKRSFNEAINQILVKNRIEDLCSYNDLIYHYTSSTGIDGILLQKKDDGYSPLFWFSRYDCLNDKSEGNDIKDVYDRVLERLFTDGSIEEKFYDIAKDVSLEDHYIFNYDTEPMIPEGRDVEYPMTNITVAKGNAYVCCFSKNKDSLAMWNYYVKGGSYNGYNIGLFAANLKENAKKAYGRGYNCKLMEVIYKEEKKEEIITGLLLELYKEFKTYSRKPKSSEILKSSINGFINTYRFSMKKECFAYEEELRMVITIPDDNIKEAIHQKTFEIKYRENNGFIIPYIEYDEISSDLIYELNFGPMDVSDEKKESKRKILIEKYSRAGYCMDVGYSDIPVRY